VMMMMMMVMQREEDKQSRSERMLEYQQHATVLHQHLTLLKAEKMVECVCMCVCLCVCAFLPVSVCAFVRVYVWGVTMVGIQL
jgi:hypothetical protein